MKSRRVLAGIAGVVLMAAAGVAVAANFTSSQTSDFYSPGKHQFYVWCANETDRIAYQTGASAQDAQSRLYKAEKASGAMNCWPVWQGRISS